MMTASTRVGGFPPEGRGLDEVAATHQMSPERRYEHRRAPRPARTAVWFRRAENRLFLGKSMIATSKPSTRVQRPGAPPGSRPQGALASAGADADTHGPFKNRNSRARFFEYLSGLGPVWRGQTSANHCSARSGVLVHRNAFLRWVQPKAIMTRGSSRSNAPTVRRTNHAPR